MTVTYLAARAILDCPHGGDPDDVCVDCAIEQSAELKERALSAPCPVCGARVQKRSLAVGPLHPFAACDGPEGCHSVLYWQPDAQAWDRVAIPMRKP